MTITAEKITAAAAGSGTIRNCRVLAFMEASSITGPAKNLIECAVQARNKTESSQRVEVSIATYQRGNSTTPNAFIASAREAGIHVDVIRESYPFDLRVLPQIRSTVDAIQPHAIQTHSVKSHFLVWLMGLHRRYPWIAFHHGYTSIDWKDRLYRGFNLISLPAAHRVITVCGAFASDLQRMGVDPARVEIRHNMVKPFVPSRQEQIAEIRTRLGLRQGEFVLLSAGRLSREKGHIDVVEAIARLRGNWRDLPLKVIIAGDGPERQNINLRSQKLGIADLVLLVGHQPDLRPYYTMADVFLLPSHSEGSPNVLLEAMSAGVAIVATSVGGVPEIAVDGIDALLVEKRRPELLAEAITRVIADNALRRELGNRARYRAAAFSAEAYCGSMLSLYSRTVKDVSQEEG